MKVAVERRSLRLREPLETAYGAIPDRDLLVLRLETGDGLVGYGEGAPLEPYDGVSVEAVEADLEECLDLLEAGDPLDRDGLLAAARSHLTGAPAGVPNLLEACRQRCALPQTLAAIDLALWDLAARRAGVPVARLIDPEASAVTAVNALIGATAPEAAAREAASAATAGFQTVKVKVGLPGDDERVAAVREAVGPAVRIRVDANGAWEVAEAIECLRELSRHAIELCEEPVHGVEELRAVREAGTGVPLAIDESATDPAAVRTHATELVCLKLARCGGISGCLAVASASGLARDQLYVASTLDGPVGIAAGVHLAAALGGSPASGLATLGLFEGVDDPFELRQGSYAVPAGPGV
jgi:L-alanine-DL-glutamate epimerase-like enolase superfamily enzyme